MITFNEFFKLTYSNFQLEHVETLNSTIGDILLMKNLLKFIFIAGVLVFAASFPAIAQELRDCEGIEYNGSGTKSEPYLIESYNQLECIPQGASQTYALSKDIRAVSDSRGEEFEPIDSFGGNLYGRDHTVYGIVISDESGAGMLSEITDGGLVKNLTIRNASVAVEEWNAGILSGINRGQISGVKTYGVIDGGSSVGGITGKNYGNINRSQSESSISGDYYVGGIVGENMESGNITIAYSKSQINIVGEVGGGFVGRNGGIISSSYSASNVSSNGWNYSGGFMGINSGNISKTYWIRDSIPSSYRYSKELIYLNSSRLKESQMKGKACGMRWLNFSENWDANNDSFPSIQDVTAYENESRNCTYADEETGGRQVEPYTSLIVLLIFLFINYRLLVYVDSRL
jgi:hypothetical protein